MVKSVGSAIKRVVSVVLILLLVCCLLPISALGELVDVESMDYSSLLALKQAVDFEIHSRPEAEPFTLKPGDYTVGTDIKAGKYFLIFAEPGEQMYVQVRIYADKATFDADYGNYFNEDDYMEAKDSPLRVDLQEGNYIIIYYSSLKFSTIDFGDEDYYTYSAPEGTLVPIGTYTVGDDLPAGSYTAYPTDIEEASIYIYDNAEAFAAREGSYTKFYIDASMSESETTFKLKEGNIMFVDRAVVMKKNAALSFGD